MPGPAVCFDGAAARILIEAGIPVLLCGTDGDALGAVARSLGHAARSHDGYGRVGVMVADPASGADLDSAVAMAGELFGMEAIVVISVDQARRITDRAREIDPKMG